MLVKAKKTEAQNVDISPLIDMVFILLIFFIVSTTFVKDMKIDLDRPGASSAEMASDKSLKIYISAEGKIFIDGEEIRSWVVQGIVRERIAADSDTPILIVTDRQVQAGLLVEVVDSCRLAGATDIGVATEGEGGA